MLNFQRRVLYHHGSFLSGCYEIHQNFDRNQLLKAHNLVPSTIQSFPIHTSSRMCGDVVSYFLHHMSRPSSAPSSSSPLSNPVALRERVYRTFTPVARKTHRHFHRSIPCCLVLPGTLKWNGIIFPVPPLDRQSVNALARTCRSN